MKYTSFLAGVLGLMALTACNDEEVIVEQPQVGRSITVTLGKGADTRLSFSDYSESAGIKGFWTAGDQIGLATDAPAGITYQAAGSGEKSRFDLVGSTMPTVGTQYNVWYPATYLTTGFDLSNQTGLFEDLVNYTFAHGQVTFSSTDDDIEVTLTPVSCAFVIPAGTVFPYLNGIEGDFSQAAITLLGNNIMTGITIEPAAPVTGNITIDAGSTALFEETSDGVQTAVDIYIVIPTGGTAKTSALQLDVAAPSTVGTHVTYNIVDGDGNSVSVAGSDAGSVFKITTENLELDGAIV